MESSVLKVSNESQSCLGTGFVIDKDENGVYLVTCGHVVNKCKDDILVEGKKAEVVENHYNKDLDLAILYVKELNFDPLPIGSSASEIEITTVKVIGYSILLGNPKKEAIANIPIKLGIEINKPTKTVYSLKLSPSETISNGYSGSPVICEKSGSVVGVVNIQAFENDVNYAIDIRHLHEIFDIKPINYKYPSIKENQSKPIVTLLTDDQKAIVKYKLEQNLENALKSFSTQTPLWIEPRLHNKPEGSNSNYEDERVVIQTIIDNPHSLIIRARQQYGLTSLSHYFANKAWDKDKNSFWLYLDANELKPHSKDISTQTTKKLEEYKLSYKDIECVILDEFSASIKDANKILDKVSSYFQDIPLIVMVTLVDNPLMNEEIFAPENRNFEILHLWSLPRQDIRKVVTQYNNNRYVGDENIVLEKVVSDLEVLNIPRTPLNCLTMLKISEIGFDDSPVNRTEMIKRVLYLLFNIDEIPKYKTRPDLKDTEFIMGYFCEKMIKENEYYFSRQSFIKELTHFCDQQEIDLEVDIVFDVLYLNNIIVARHDGYCFKFSYWIFYFAANRMQQNEEFADYILSDMRYTSFPELIEFYTGLNRQQNDALNILIADIQNIRSVVNKKIGLPDGFDIYKLAQWKPTDESILEMHEEVSSGALNSNLPNEIKDQYADRSYNKKRPLQQSIHHILEEFSLLRLMKSISAGSKALRNSDYANPDIKHRLLQEILLSWEEVVKDLIVITPALVKDNAVTVDGATFTLYGNFGESDEERFNRIIQVIPSNVVGWFKNDLFSKKMGSLLFKHTQNEKNELLKHVLNLLIISKRPKGWDTYIADYISKTSKNSFYLLDVYLTLRAEYKYSFASNYELKSMENLIKSTATKHFLGAKNPSKKLLKKIEENDGFKNVLPDRNEF